MIRCIAGTMAAAALALPGAAWAGAVIQSMTGEVRVGSSEQVLVAARTDQRLAAGTTIVTGPGALVVLKMDDGGQMVVGQASQFRIVDSAYAQNSPQADRAVFDLVRGALRVITGAIGERSRGAWSLRVPQMTIGVRGTDFMVVLTNQAYVQVSQGAISVGNGFGSSVLTAGTVATVPSSAAAAAVIPASSLPSAATTAFSAMGSAPGVVALSGPATGAAAGTAGGVAGGGIGAGAAVAIGAAAAAAAAASGGGDSTTTTHH